MDEIPPPEKRRHNAGPGRGPPDNATVRLSWPRRRRHALLGLMATALAVSFLSWLGFWACPYQREASSLANGGAKLPLRCSLRLWTQGSCARAGNALLDDVPSELPYYGRSPPIYPSPIGNGSSSKAWARAHRAARALVGQMTLEEKVNMTYGWPGPCVGNSAAIPRLGLPSLCFADGPNCVRGHDFVSAFPAGIHLAATFDADLMYRYGKAVGDEFHGKGAHVALGPVAGPLGRIARGGRNWEGLSNDPYLAGIALGAVTRGMQDAGVVATPKHFLLNEQEFRRRDTAHQRDGDGIIGEAVSSNVDDRTLHELYAFPFMNALAAGAGAVMSSYQRANHSYASQNAKLLNGILKTELGFEGFVISDWDSQHSGVAAALAGLDLAMPGSTGYWSDGLLLEAVKNGSVPVSRVEDMVARLLAALYFVQGPDAAEVPSLSSPQAIYSHWQEDVQADHADLIRAIGAAGTVLLKNVNNTLPLRAPRYLCVYGYDAVVKAVPWDNPDRYGGGYDVNFGWNTLNGTMVTAGGSGSVTPPYVVSPFEALQGRVRQDRGMLRWDFYSEKPTVYENAEACLVFINAYASETFDRPSLTDQFSDNLVRNVAGLCANTIVVVHSAGIRVVDAWIDHPNVTAVLFAGLPGQESGHALVDVLYGDVNPSGRLPYTVARREEDYGALLNSSVSTAYYPDDDFSEGLFTDYRAFDRAGLAPRFPFGHGLSYTTFVYGPGLTASLSPASPRPVPELPDPSVAVVQGGHPALWETVVTVRCRVTNSGAAAGTDVVQLYVGVPGANVEHAANGPSTSTAAAGDSPVRQLRGFQRTRLLAPGESADVVLPLTRRDLSVWDVSVQQWRLRRGTYRLYVGASSRDLRVNGTFNL